MVGVGTAGAGVVVVVTVVVVAGGIVIVVVVVGAAGGAGSRTSPARGLSVPTGSFGPVAMPSSTRLAVTATTTATRAKKRRGRRSRRSGPRARGCRGEPDRGRQSQDDVEASSVRVPKLERAAVRGDEAVHDREAEPRPGPG